MKTFDIRPGYYYWKMEDGRWVVSGRRNHLQTTRTESPTGREDRRGHDVVQTIYLVEDHRRPASIDTDDQFEIEPHGFTTLKDAVAYAADKLEEYDERVDPKGSRCSVMGSRFFPPTPKLFREQMRAEGKMLVHVARWRDLSSDLHETAEGAWGELVRLAEEVYGIDIEPMPGEKMGDIFYQNGTSGIRPEKPERERSVAILEVGPISHVDPAFPYGK